MRVVVIGAGFGGLSAAAHLIGTGHQVTVVEQRSSAGGSAAALHRDGFTLDLGPTVFTMPELLGEAFDAVGARMADHVQIEPVDPMYRAVFADGSSLFVRHGRSAMVAEIERFSGGRDADGFVAFCEWVTELYRIQMPNFIDTNVDSAFDVLRSWRAALALVRAGGLRRLDTKVASFFADERLRRVFSFQSMYAGVAPHRALALYSVITYMDTVAGVWRPRGGLHAAARSLASVIEGAGASFRYDTAVASITRDGAGRASGVELADGERVAADAVVCNVDLPTAYTRLLDGVRPPRAAVHGTYSPSCVLWVAGVRGRPPSAAAHHNVHIGTDWRDAFDDVIEHGRPMDDPSMFVSAASIDDPSVAPTGSTALYALEPMPNLDGRVDWPRETDALTERLRQRVGAAGYPVDGVVVERTIDPTGWADLGFARGTPFGLAHTWRQTGPLRPGIVEPRVPGLFFAGSSTQPGVGVPMVLISGKLAARRVAAFTPTASARAR